MRQKYKLVFLGDQNVGKTTLISQFVYRQADKNYEPTIGIDFLAKKIEVDDKEVKLQLWDTAGQEKFYSIISSYARGSFLAVILFDVGNEATLLKIDKLVEDFIVPHNLDTKERDRIKILIVGNKIDLVSNDKLSIINSKAMKKAKGYGGTYVPASAASYEGIKLVVDKIVDFLREDIDKGVPEDKNEEVEGRILKSGRCC